MELNTDLWYVKWFFWSCDVLDYFTKTSEGRRWKKLRRHKFEEKGITLCQFIRTIGWGVLLYTLQIMVYTLTLYAFVIKPFLLFSAASVLTIVGIVVGSIATFIGVIFGLIWGVGAAVDIIAELNANKSPAKTADKPSFLKVFWEFIKAEKRKICPLIQFTETPVVITSSNIAVETSSQGNEDVKNI